MLYLEAAEDSVDVSNGLRDGAFTTIFLGCLLMPKPTVGKQLRLTETSEILSKLLPVVSSKIYLFTIFKKPLMTS